jgi:hypothetical protein
MIQMLKLRPIWNILKKWKKMTPFTKNNVWKTMPMKSDKNQWNTEKKQFNMTCHRKN